MLNFYFKIKGKFFKEMLTSVYVTFVKKSNILKSY